MFQAKGTLKYEGIRDEVSLRLMVSQDLMRLYHRLIPKSQCVMLPGYRAHISVLRNTQRIKHHPKKELWGKFEGSRIPFFVDPFIVFGERHCWVNCYSRPLESILRELEIDMPNTYETSEGIFYRKFHVTVGLL